MNTKRQNKYNELSNKGLWDEANSYIDEWLLEEQDDIWLVGQKASILYELKKFDEAFDWSSRAICFQPCEPLLLWTHAGILDALGNKREAFLIWRKIAFTSSKVLGEVDCSEGVAWANSLRLDCLYCMIKMLKSQRKISEARKLSKSVNYLIKRGAKSVMYPTES